MKFWKCLHVHAICNLYLCICYNFALVWHENSLVFSQLDSCNCFLYIIMKIIMSENKHLVIYFRYLVLDHNISHDCYNPNVYSFLTGMDEL